MPGETTHFQIRYALEADEAKPYPQEVSEPGMKKIDEVLYEGNKLANGESYSAWAKKSFGVEYEPSITRPAFVMATVQFTGATQSTELRVGLIQIGEYLSAKATAEEGTWMAVSFVCPAATTWIFSAGAGGVTPHELKVSTLLL